MIHTKQTSIANPYKDIFSRWEKKPSTHEKPTFTLWEYTKFHTAVRKRPLNNMPVGGLAHSEVTLDECINWCIHSKGCTTLVFFLLVGP